MHILFSYHTEFILLFVSPEDDVLRTEEVYYTLRAQIPTFAKVLDRSIMDENLDGVWSLLSRVSNFAF